MANELSEKDLKRPDEFETFFGRLLGKLIEQRTHVLWALVALVGVSVAAVFWNLNAEKRNLQAANRWAAVIGGFPKGGADIAGWEKFLKDLDLFLTQDSGSSFIPSAKLYRGKTLLSLGRYPEAISAFEDAVRGLPKPALFLAEEGKALALMESQRWDEAEAVWLRLSGEKENPSRAFHTWNLGLAREGGKRIGAAIQTYQEFETSFSDSKDLLERVRARLTVLRQGSPPS